MYFIIFIRQNEAILVDNIKDLYFNGSSILKYCLVSVLSGFINFARHQILNKPLTNFSLDFLHFVEETMNTKMCKFYRRNFPLTAII